MDKLQQYISRATRGLYGTKKLEIEAELRGSIEARIWQLEMQGNTNTLETALLEMGAVNTINLGLIKEHLMPKLLKNTVLFGLFLTSGFAVLNSSRAQIEVVIYPSSMNFFYLSFSSIKTNLEAAGLTVDDTPVAPQEKTMAYSLSTKPSLRFRFPGATKDLVLQTAPGYDSPWKNEFDALIHNPKPAPTINSDYGRYFISIYSFLHQLKKTGLPIRLEGWRNPKLSVGRTHLQIGSEKVAVTPWDLYSSIAGTALNNPNQPEFRFWGFKSLAAAHAVRINAPVGTVYAVATSYRDDSNKVVHHIDVAPVGQNGILYFKAPHSVIEFVKSRAELQIDFVNVDKTNYGSSTHPAKALLIRMNSDLTTTFAIPDRTRSAVIR
jgi:hypothetical protein